MNVDAEQGSENTEAEAQGTGEEQNHLYEETLLDSNEAIEFAPGMCYIYIIQIYFGKKY